MTTEETTVDAPLTPQEFSLRRKMLLCPERIIYLIDLHEEMSSIWDEEKNRLEVVKDGIISMSRRKCHSRYKHQFAIATFSGHNEYNLLLDFTSDIDKLQDIIKTKLTCSPTTTTSLSNNHQNENTNALDFGILFSNLSHSIGYDSSVSHTNQTSNSSPLTRCILFFGRSKEVPIISFEASILYQPYFFVDVVYLHLKITEEGVRCQEIYDMLSQLPTEANPYKVSYIFETHHSALRLHTYLAALLAHPVNREHQSELLTKIEVTAESLAAIRELDTVIAVSVNGVTSNLKS